MAIDGPVRIAVEGDHDAEIAKCVLQHVGLSYEEPIVAGGKGELDKRLRGYNNAARHAPWLVLRDLDRDACAPVLLKSLLVSPASQMRLRIVVRAAEAWLLADEESLCRFLGVERHDLRQSPESIENPKLALVNLARKSRDRAIVRDMVAPEGTRRIVGRGYSARILEYVREQWRPGVAATRSDSLRRCIEVLKQWT